MKVHLLTDHGPACGADALAPGHVWSKEITSTRSKYGVTCGNCVRTLAYKNRGG